MGIALSTLWEKLFGSEQYKIVMVGLNAAGKTTTLYKLLLGEVVVTSPTVGSNVEEITYKNVKLQVWDVGGQESLRASWAIYYQNAHAVIFVVDSTDRDRIDVAKIELFSLLNSTDLHGAAVLIFANKQDKEGAMSVGDITKTLGLTAVKDHDWQIQPCCALTGQGLFEGLDWISKKIRKK